MLTREGRLLAFPNVLQHRVSSFKLADPTKPGYRKILALLLVDPHTRVLSTANVPPQQESWLSKEAKQTTESVLGELAHLPNELADRIIDQVCSSTMTMEEAKEEREKLMKERRGFVEDVESSFQSDIFDFCEH